MNKDTYKLYYFKGNGRGASIRALLRYKKIDYENNYISEEWPKMKASGKFEYLQMPGLEINGKMYVQSDAIMKYLGRKFDLMGKTPEEEYEINNIFDSVQDLWNAVSKYGYPENDAMKKDAEKYKAAFLEKITHYLTVYQKKYESAGKKKYLLGDHMTIADIHIPMSLLAFKAYFGGVAIWADKAPEVVAILEKNAKADLKEFYEKDCL